MAVVTVRVIGDRHQRSDWSDAPCMPAALQTVPNLDTAELVAVALTEFPLRWGSSAAGPSSDHEYRAGGGEARPVRRRHDRADQIHTACCGRKWLRGGLCWRARRRGGRFHDRLAALRAARSLTCYCSRAYCICAFEAKRRRFLEHVAFSMHFVSFALLSSATLVLAIRLRFWLGGYLFLVIGADRVVALRLSDGGDPTVLSDRWPMGRPAAAVGRCRDAHIRPEHGVHECSTTGWRGNRPRLVLLTGTRPPSSHRSCHVFFGSINSFRPSFV